MITARGLRKAFRTRTGQLFWTRQGPPMVAVDGLSLDVEPGEIVGLLGLNGAGKTTTIKMLTTLLEPDAGHATVDGHDVVAHAARVRPLVNMIAGGERSLYTRLTGRENLWYFAQLYEVPRRETAERIDDLLELVGLTEAAAARVETYSKGMRQRLQIARGLVNRPRYLFLDEPTLGLDVPVARHLRAVTRKLAKEQGCGIVLTSHYMAEVEELCDRIVVLHRGRVVREGTTAEIRAAAHAERVTLVVIEGETDDALLRELRATLGPTARVEAEPSDGGTTLRIHAREALTAQAVAALAGRGRRVLRAESVEPSLEDALVALADST